MWLVTTEGDVRSEKTPDEISLYEGADARYRSQVVAVFLFLKFIILALNIVVCYNIIRMNPRQSRVFPFNSTCYLTIEIMKRIATVLFLLGAAVISLSHWPHKESSLTESVNTATKPGKSTTSDKSLGMEVTGNVRVTIDPGTETQEPIAKAQ